MKVLAKLTVRQLKENWKRTLMTLCGVIISVAMLSAVFIFASSFLNMMKESEIIQYGNWDAEYGRPEPELLEAVKNSDELDYTFTKEILGYSRLDKVDNELKPYLYLEGYSDKAFDELPLSLLEGRLPANEHEIIIPAHLRSDGGLDYKIGDTMTLTLSNRFYKDEDGEIYELQTYSRISETEYLVPREVREFTITGIMERMSSERTYTPSYNVLTWQNEMKDNGVLYVNAKDGKSLNSFIEKTEGMSETFSENRSLTRLKYPSSDDTMVLTVYTFGLAVSLIIVIGSVSLIYNAFSISLAERSRYYGLLSSIGATQKQRRFCVYLEAVWLALIAIPIGLMAGYLGMRITFYFANSMIASAFNEFPDGMKAIVDLPGIILVVVLTGVTLFLSVMVPARRAGRMSAMEAVRQSKDIKLSKKEVKTSWLTKKVFGIEGELALKNIKRNRKKYNATILSLIISMVLFTNVNMAISLFKKSATVIDSNEKYDYEISNVSIEKAASVREELLKIDGIENVAVILNTYADTEAEPERMVNPEVYSDSQKVIINVQLIGLNEEELKRYCEKAKIDYNQLYDMENPSGIVLNSYMRQEEKKYVERKVFKKGPAELNIKLYNKSENKELPLHILDYSEVQFDDADISSGDNFAAVIVSDTVFKQYFNLDEYARLQIKAPEWQKVEKPLHAYVKEAGYMDYLSGVQKQKQSVKDSINLVTLFTNGFIVLITMICIVNVFNTITTNIQLRRRETAMLKSIGMDARSFNKMICFESLFYGIKAMIYGVPASLFLMYFVLYALLRNSFSFDFFVPWQMIGTAVLFVFVIVTVLMMYGYRKIRKENIIDELKQDS